MHSLHRRLTLGLLGAFTLLLVAGSGALYWAMRASLLAQFDAGLRIKALVVITGSEQKKERLEVRFSDHFLREFDDDVATDFFQVTIEGGKSVKRSESLGKDDLPRHYGTLENPEYWDMRLPGGHGAGRAIGIKFRPRMDKRDAIALANPIDAIVVVAGQREELNAILRRLRLVLAVGGLSILLATSLAVPLVLRPGLRPVRRVADLAQVIDATTLERRFPTTDMPSELRPICERLNDLLARLAASFARERRFSADLAHELLTPLAEMRAIAESALKWPETAGPDDYKQSVEIMIRMENLVKQVLELARAEHGGTKLKLAPVDVAELVERVVRSHAATAKDRKIEIALSGPPALTVGTDVGVLQVIVGNLVSNAVAYAPEGSTVRVTWKIDDAVFELSVVNAAPEIGPGDLPQLFDRFWRKDPSRTETQHSGLGLSLALELARLLGGKLVAAKSSDSDSDLIFTLTLPLASGNVLVRANPAPASHPSMNTPVPIS